MSNDLEPRFNPTGRIFFDLNSRREMMLVTDGPWKGWISYKHPDGQWVSLREATPADKAKIAVAAVKPHLL